MTEQRRPVSLWIARAVLVFVILELIIGWVWRTPFIRGEISGPYFLLWVYNYGIPALILICIFGWLAAVMSFFAVYIRLRIRDRNVLMAFITMTLAGIILAPAAFPALIARWYHLDTRVMDGNRYYLATESGLMESSLFVFECNRSGLWCDTIFAEASVPPGVTMTTTLEAQPGGSGLDILACTPTTDCTVIQSILVNDGE